MNKNYQILLSKSKELFYNLYDNIVLKYPELNIDIVAYDKNIDLEILIQLDFSLSITLQVDEVHFYLPDMSCIFFPITNKNTYKIIEQSIIAIIDKKARTANSYRKNKCYKSEFQINNNNNNWITLNTEIKNLLFLIMFFYPSNKKYKLI